MGSYTPAEAMFHYKGIGYCKKYLDRSKADEDGSKLDVCSAGHADCAHYKKGPCMVEMKALIKAHNKPKAAPASESCAGELMAYGISPEEALAGC